MQGMFDVGLSVWVNMRPTTASAVVDFQGRSFDFVGVLCTCFGLGFWHLGFWLWAFGRFQIIGLSALSFQFRQFILIFTVRV